MHALHRKVKFIHLFMCFIFVILFHGKILGETFIAVQDASIKENNALLEIGRMLMSMENQMLL